MKFQTNPHVTKLYENVLPVLVISPQLSHCMSSLFICLHKRLQAESSKNEEAVYVRSRMQLYYYFVQHKHTSLKYCEENRNITRSRRLDSRCCYLLPVYFAIAHELITKNHLLYIVYHIAILKIVY